MKAQDHNVRRWVTLVLLATSPVWAQSRKRQSDANVHAELAQLKRQVEEQRAMLGRILQYQKAHLELLMRAVYGGDVGGHAAVSPGDSEAALETLPALKPPREEAAARDATAAREERKEPAREARPRPSRGGAASVSGRVSVSGGSLEGAVVYVASVRSRSARGGKLEIKQVDKQFSPRVAVVARGTRVEFPNYDTIFHNVFSVSPGNSFDLGTYRAGDKPGAVALHTPGVVQIFCNMHSEMSATILVTPSELFAKVSPDGSFKLANVPPGHHRIAAWAPNADVEEVELDVPSGGALEVDFSLEAKQKRPHSNKFGQPYGSYGD